MDKIKSRATFFVDWEAVSLKYIPHKMEEKYSSTPVSCIKRLFWRVAVHGCMQVCMCTYWAAVPDSCQLVLEVEHCWACQAELASYPAFAVWFSSSPPAPSESYISSPPTSGNTPPGKDKHSWRQSFLQIDLKHVKWFSSKSFSCTFSEDRTIYVRICAWLGAFSSVLSSTRLWQLCHGVKSEETSDPVNSLRYSPNIIHRHETAQAFSYPAVGRFVHVTLHFACVSYEILHATILQCCRVRSGEDSLHTTHTQKRHMWLRASSSICWQPVRVLDVICHLIQLDTDVKHDCY